MKEVMDCKGMKCPKPVLKIAIKANSLQPGTVLEVHADCSTFPDDVKKWCSDSGKVLVNCVTQGTVSVATIQF
jgi:tRNA 2-thiouridine synthesizing protein A